MHIPENYLSPATCAVMGAAMIPVWVHAVKKVKEELPSEKIAMVGVGAAFSFLGMMFNVPLVGGTTGHAVGGTLIALLFGPNAACIAVSIALLLQAVLFGDGGVLAFGANCFNMAFVIPYVGYAVYKLVIRASGGEAKAKMGRRILGAAVGSYIGLNAAALCAAIEFGIQPLVAHDASGAALYCPYGLEVAIPAMMIPHLAVAGIVEAVFTVAIYTFVRRTSPDLTYLPGAAADANDLTGKADDVPKKSRIPVFALVAVLIAATPLGLLATGTAWGEWGADEIAEVVTDGSALGYTPAGLENGWELNAPMPDYSLEGMGEVTAYILSAVIGTALLVIIFKLFSLALTGKKRRAI
ncbi:MAG: cobalt transporter CbiM [Lachnospiraceae bacterium]|nr:cobalt transporter CbiM [Lachnospiraceae bacterium]